MLSAWLTNQHNGAVEQLLDILNSCKEFDDYITALDTHESSILSHYNALVSNEIASGFEITGDWYRLILRNLQIDNDIAGFLISICPISRKCIFTVREDTDPTAQYRCKIGLGSGRIEGKFLNRITHKKCSFCIDSCASFTTNKKEQFDIHAELLTILLDRSTVAKKLKQLGVSGAKPVLINYKDNYPTKMLPCGIHFNFLFSHHGVVQY